MLMVYCSVHCSFPSSCSLIQSLCGWGDRALQECNLSTQSARALQQALPRPIPQGMGRLAFSSAILLQSRHNAKNSSPLTPCAGSWPLAQYAGSLGFFPPVGPPANGQTKHGVFPHCIAPTPPTIQPALRK